MLPKRISVQKFGRYFSKFFLVGILAIIYSLVVLSHESSDT